LRTKRGSKIIPEPIERLARDVLRAGHRRWRLCERIEPFARRSDVQLLAELFELRRGAERADEALCDAAPVGENRAERYLVDLRGTELEQHVRGIELACCRSFGRV